MKEGKISKIDLLFIMTIMFLSGALVGFRSIDSIKIFLAPKIAFANMIFVF